MTTTTNLSVLDFNFEISVLKHEEVISPWSPEMGRVTKYLLQVRNVDTDTDFTFDYHTSIHDCNSEQRDLIDQFNNWLNGGEQKQIDRRRANLRAIANHTNGSGIMTYTEEKWLMENLRAYQKMVTGTKYRAKRVNKWAVYEIAGFLTSDEVWPRNRKADVSALLGGPKSVAPKLIDDMGLKLAFYNAVSDAISGTYDIDTFQSEFGYTKVSECLRVHRACQKMQRDLAYLGVNEGAMYDVINALQEMNIC